MTQEQLERVRRLAAEPSDAVVNSQFDREALAAVLADRERLDHANEGLAGTAKQLMTERDRLIAIGDRLADALELSWQTAAPVRDAVREWREARK